MQVNKQKHEVKYFKYNLIDSTMNVAKFWNKSCVTDDLSYSFVAD